MNKKRIFGIIAAIILGAAGSGLWELAKPGLSWVTGAALKVVTLGLTSLHDNIYLEAARGYREATAQSVLGILTGILFILITLWLLDHKEKGEFWKYVKTSFSPKIILLCGVISYTLLAVRTSYITSTISYFEQLMAISSPYLTNEDCKLLRSRFAQMKSKNDYIALVDKLKAVANQNKQSVPTMKLY